MVGVDSTVKSESSKRKTALHSGHRNRLKSKLLKGGDCCLEPHELLEILLFYSIPRINTNEIAHKILDKFDSVSVALDSSPKELMEIEGVGKSSTSLILALGEARRRLYDMESDVFSEIYSAVSVFKGDHKIKSKYRKCVQSVKKLAERVRKEGYYAVVITEENGILYFLEKCDNKAMTRFSESLKHNVFGNFAKGVVLLRYTKDKNVIPSNVELERVGAVRSAIGERHVPLWEYFVVSGDCMGNISDIVGAKDWK